MTEKPEIFLYVFDNTQLAVSVQGHGCVISTEGPYGEGMVVLDELQCRRLLAKLTKIVDWMEVHGVTEYSDD